MSWHNYYTVACETFLLAKYNLKLQNTTEDLLNQILSTNFNVLCTHTHARTHARTHTHAHTHTHTHTQTHAYAHTIHTHAVTRAHTHMHTLIHSHM